MPIPTPALTGARFPALMMLILCKATGCGFLELPERIEKSSAGVAATTQAVKENTAHIEESNRALAKLMGDLEPLAALGPPLERAAELKDGLVALQKLEEPMSNLAPLGEQMRQLARLEPQLRAVAGLAVQLEAAARLGEPLAAAANLREPLDQLRELRQPLVDAGRLAPALREMSALVDPLTKLSRTTDQLPSQGALVLWVGLGLVLWTIATSLGVWAGLTLATRHRRPTPRPVESVRSAI
jgi:hypothetical protein